MSKVIIAGSRSIVDPELVCKAMVMFCQSMNTRISELVCGGAGGVDLVAKEIMEQKNSIVADNAYTPIKMFPADRNKHGKSAGYKRNQQMAEYADILLAIWDGESRGTKHMIDIMQKANKPVCIYSPDYLEGIPQ